MNKLAGILCVRNGFLLDYCWMESASSLLGVCDELVLCDCDSTDGTRQAMDDMAGLDPRINICNFPWTDPVRSNEWWPEYFNYARQHARSNFVAFLDADELFHERDYPAIRGVVERGETVWCHRYNFWRDAQHLIPEGQCCGTRVLRIGPRDFWYPSDYPDPKGRDGDILRKAVTSDIKIYHYGFLRKRDAFFRKARVVQHIWTGSFDPRLARAEQAGGNWMEHKGVTGWEDQLVDFTGSHPDAAQAWLKARGYHA